MISVEDGLSSHHVNFLLFDRTGYLWIGTGNGLNRYDGYRFVHFMTSHAIGYSLDSHEVIDAAEDSRGKLFILSKGGIGMYDTKTGEISLFPSATIDASLETSNTLVDLTTDMEDNLWILSGRNLIRMDNGQRFTSLPLPQDGISYSPTCLASGYGDEIWIGTTRGLMVFNRQTSGFSWLSSGNYTGLLSHNHVTCLFTTADRSLWVGTMNGLNRFDPVDFDFEHYYPSVTHTPQSANEIRHLSGEPGNRLIVTTANGISLFEPERNTFIPVYESQGNSVTAAVADAAGNIWGATSRGILKVRRSNLVVHNFSPATSMLQLEHENVTALATFNNQLWLGYQNAGFDVVDIITLNKRHVDLPGGMAIVGIYPYYNEEVIVACNHDLLFYSPYSLNGKTLKEKYYFTNNRLLEQANINCLARDSANRIWIGTSDGLQMLYPGVSAHTAIRILTSGSDSIVLGEVYDIEIGPGGNLWMGTETGLVSYNPVSGNFYKYTPYDKILMNTETKKVFTLSAEIQNILWLGTSGGIFSFDMKSTEFTALRDYPEIMDLSVRAIEIDRLRNIWIGTEKGLYYYLRNTGSMMFFDPSNGFINYAYTAAHADARGNVYVGGEHGLSIINTATIESRTYDNRVVITSMSDFSSGSEKNIRYSPPDTVYLRGNRNTIRIDFAVLDLSRPQHNRFRYSFEKAGKSEEWYHIGLQNHVILDNLTRGIHIFKVTGTNANMVWNPNGATLVLIVKPFFLRSQAAMVFYGLAALLLLFALFRYLAYKLFNISEHNKEKEMIARQIMEQKEELAIKNKSITDSINYAKRIQTAILPPYKLLTSIFPSSFILYMPKDIVSGDFYWINKLNEKIFVAAVDCTGHGVPGAFMSIIGFELFRKITSIEGLSRPSDILNRLNEDFHEIFKDVDNVVLRDGMDVALCSIDKNDKILEFAGALNPLYLIRDKKITEVKGDRFSIGLDEINFKDQTFKNHLIPLQDGDIIYLFSDGFADQFGGPDGKKYKYRRFKHLLLNLHQLSMEKQREILEKNVLDWRGEQEQVDDILIVGIKIDF